MKLRFLSIAEKELSDAISHYEHQRPGLGHDFAAEALRAADRALAFPAAWPVMQSGIRRCRFNRFPYALLYAIEDDALLVIAVAHMHREPDYWRNRLKDKDAW